MNEHPRTRQRVLIALVASLAVIAFVESYQGLYHAAAAGGRPMPWLWPCAVEGFTLAMNVAIWDARSRHRHAPWAWFLLILATAVSTVLQVLDVLEGTVAASGHVGALGVLTAAWTPIALLLSFERWMWLAYGDNSRSEETAPAEAQRSATEISRPATPVAALARPVAVPTVRATRPKASRRSQAGTKRGERTQEARQWLQEQQAGGGERPATNALVTEVTERFGLARSSRLRDLVTTHWPEETVTDANQDSKEDPAA